MSSIRSHAGLLALLWIVSAVSACGPSVYFPPGPAPELRRLAVLPVRAPSNLTDERKAYLESTLRSELENKGYLFLDPVLVEAACNDESCSDALHLHETYPIDAYVQLSIDSTRAANFGIGFYKTLAGSLRLLNTGGEELFRAEHRQSERGGLVFESGQVFEGLQQQFRNSRDESFRDLGLAFVQSLSQPIPDSVAPLDQPIPEISQVTLRRKGRGVYRVCAMGTAATTAVAHLAGVPAQLRPTKPGKFCGEYRLPRQLTEIEVELRSAFGAVDRETVPLDYQNSCNLSKRHVSAKPARDGIELRFRCVAFGDEELPGCQEPFLQHCQNASVWLFKSRGQGRGVARVARIRSARWKDSRGTPANYYVVVMREDGTSGGPIQVPVMK